MNAQEFLRDEYDDPRDFALEAKLILQGLTGLMPTLEHLRALDEAYQIRLIQIAKDMERLKNNVLNRP